MLTFFCYHLTEHVYRGNFLVAGTFFCGLRAVTHFRVFTQTRWLIYMIKMCFWDMRSFLLILFTSLLVFAVLHQIPNNIGELETGKKAPTFLYEIGRQYRVMFGENPDADIDNVKWILYILYGLFTVIVNLNLLITIIGETYGQVSATMEPTDCRMRATLLLEIAAFRFWNRNAGEQTYLHLLADLESNEEEEEIGSDQRIKGLAKGQEHMLNMMSDQQE